LKKDVTGSERLVYKMFFPCLNFAYCIICIQKYKKNLNFFPKTQGFSSSERHIRTVCCFHSGEQPVNESRHVQLLDVRSGDELCKHISCRIDCFVKSFQMSLRTEHQNSFITPINFYY